LSSTGKLPTSPQPRPSKRNRNRSRLLGPQDNEYHIPFDLFPAMIHMAWRFRKRKAFWVTGAGSFPCTNALERGMNVYIVDASMSALIET